MWYVRFSFYCVCLFPCFRAIQINNDACLCVLCLLLLFYAPLCDCVSYVVRVCLIPVMAYVCVVVCCVWVCLLKLVKINNGL